MRYLRFRSCCISIWAVTAVLLFILTGCGSSSSRVVADDAPKLPTKVDGADDKNIIKMRKDLTKRGVRIISLGQNYLIVIPSSLLFPEQSPRLTWESYSLLNDIACYLQEFRKISIHINAFSTPYISARREHALTRTRAIAVSNYLWSRGVDSRFIFTQGLGSDKPIVEFEKKKGDLSPNSRIEITFRRAVA